MLTSLFFYLGGSPIPQEITFLILAVVPTPLLDGWVIYEIFGKYHDKNR
jgi:hypothetical protein